MKQFKSIPVFTRVCMLLAVLGIQELFADNQSVIDNIKIIKSKIDSIDNIIKMYSDDNINYEYLKDLKIEKKIHQISIDTLMKKRINEKIDSLTRTTFPVYTFKDPRLDSTYRAGYLNPQSPLVNDSIWILSESGVASNIETGKRVYGFANIHDRKSKLRIDFELFDRIGIYSIFPGVYGCTEMIFSENKTIPVKEIQSRLVKQAHRYNTKVDLVVSYYKWDNQDNFKPRLNQDVVILNMVDSISSIVKNYKFDGVTFDFDIGRMELDDVLYYKKLIYLIHQKFNTFLKKKALNIVISTKDIFNQKKYSSIQIDSSLKESISKQISGSSNVASKKSEYNKLELLLKPDVINYVENLIINVDTTIKKLGDITEFFYDSFDSNYNSKMFILLPLYSYVKIKNGDTAGCIIQKNFCESDFIKKYNHQYLTADSSYYIDDLSMDNLNKKIDKIWTAEHSMGLALWQIEYGDSTFYHKIYEKKYAVLNSIHSPRVFVIKHMRAFRAFVDLYRCSIGIIITFLLFVYFFYISYAKIAGREKFIINNKMLFYVVGLIMTFLCYVYLITFPFKLNQLFEIATILIFVGVIIVIVIRYIYKLTIQSDLP